MGPALDRHRVRRGSTTNSQAWERWAGLIVKRRWPAGIVGLIVVIALAIPALSMNTGQPSAASLGGSSAAAQAFHELTRQGVPEAVSFPVQVLVHGGAANARSVAGTVQRTSGVWAALTPKLPSNVDGGDTLLTVIPTQAGNTSGATDTITRLRTALVNQPGQVQVGGDTAANLDFTNAIYSKFPLMLAAIAIVTFLLLARSFRSVPLALKAVVLNLISLGAAFGFIVIFWQSGHGSNLVYGVHATHAIRNWAPIIMFAFLFGISMDYEVFVLARMREEYDATGDTRRAIVSSIGHTGRLITCAALILAISFASLSTTNDIAVQVPATGLAVGVLLDAVIVRTLLVPALAALGTRPRTIPKPTAPRPGSWSPAAGAGPTFCFLPNSTLWTAADDRVAKILDRQSDARLVQSVWAGSSFLLLIAHCDKVRRRPPACCLLVPRPETARRASELQLGERIALVGPDDELKELADTFDQMLERLDAAFASQKRFVANAAHELRTPLTAMRTSIEVTLSKPARTPEQLETMAVKVRTSIQRAQATIDALLTLATSGRGPSVQEPVDLATATEDALDIAGAAIARLELDVETALAPARTTGDRVLLERMIANLVDNAIRHNNPNDGVGLGLSIANAIATVHGANLTVQSRPRGGLNISIDLPGSSGSSDHAETWRAGDGRSGSTDQRVRRSPS